MKKIRITVLSIILLFATGCTVDYNLQFQDSVLTETIKIDATDMDMTEEEIKRMLDNQLYLDAQQQSYQVKQEGKKITLSQKYNVDTYKNSLLLSQCYTAYNLIEEQDYYDLTTSSSFTCNPFDYMDIDELKIKIKTNHKVLSHNADSIENNTYIWNITTQNAGNKPIQIRFSKDTKEDKMYLIILGITVIIAIIILFVAFHKKKNNNEI